MRPLVVFLAVAFGVSWALGGVLALLGRDLHIALRTAIMIAYMFGPALGAVLAQRVAGERPLAPLSVSLRPNRWWLYAWLMPLALQPIVLGVSLLLPGVEWSPDMSGFFERLAEALPKEQPKEQIEEAKKQMLAMPPALYWTMLLAQPLVAGLSINALAAFGEELGWRGWLFRRFAPLGFWRRALVVGALWGLWHAPVILQGHNYPQHPSLGVLFMTLFCVLVAPLADLARTRGRSVWAAAVMHGTINAAGGLSIMFVRGGGDLVVGMTGAAGLLVLAGANLVLWLLDRARGGALLRP
ncbi:MAG: CPBP family intramembrane metalloprotease [Deltaproteobacteria bacterium]|nr:CPBP family intramembrane metalloprotease [Deltaproteobacteria bacterium]